jgi:sec-independent protein translocase protein TatA
MGEFSIWHWLVVLLVVLLLFGGGKVTSLMGDFAKGIKAFKKGLSDEPNAVVHDAAVDVSAGAAADGFTARISNKEHSTAH